MKQYRIDICFTDEAHIGKQPRSNADGPRSPVHPNVVDHTLGKNVISRMPSAYSVSLVSIFDYSTNRMGSAFSAAGYLMPRSAYPDHAALAGGSRGEVGHDIFQCICLRPKLLHLPGGRRAGDISSEGASPGLKELLRPAIKH